MIKDTEKQPDMIVNGPEKMLVTTSGLMLNLLKTAKKIAGSDAPVLIQGESGTGKELLAQYIHYHSNRANLPMMAMNCASLPEQLAESELFGYEKGAFTGAFQSKPGRFESANGSTLLLDEIGELQLHLQAKLLRVLQEKQIDKIGSRNPIAADVRIIATTNRNLEAMTKEGIFREDLYYRLRVIPMKIPPLRDRHEDIPILIDYFLEKYKTDQTQSEYRFSHEALEIMQRWPWPGNVRELENAVQRALLLSPGPIIGPEDLFLSEPTQTDVTDRAAIVGLTVKELETKLIQQTLSHVNQNRTQAAKMLGISIRTLRNKLNEIKEVLPA